MSDATPELLVGLELRLLDPDVRSNPREVASLLADSFAEFGSSGQVYTKSDTVATLAAEVRQDIDAADFEVTELAPDVALVTYRANAAGVTALRSSIWKKGDGAWRMVFHQGTRLSTPS